MSATCHDGDEPSDQSSRRTVVRPSAAPSRFGFTPSTSRIDCGTVSSAALNNGCYQNFTPSAVGPVSLGCPTNGPVRNAYRSDRGSPA